MKPVRACKRMPRAKQAEILALAAKMLRGRDVEVELAVRTKPADRQRNGQWEYVLKPTNARTLSIRINGGGGA